MGDGDARPYYLENLVNATFDETDTVGLLVSPSRQLHMQFCLGESSLYTLDNLYDRWP